jgi:hypothetical protein
MGNNSRRLARRSTVRLMLVLPAVGPYIGGAMPIPAGQHSLRPLSAKRSVVMRRRSSRASLSPRSLILLVAPGMMVLLTLSACGRAGASDTSAGRPSCVTLASYGGVIQQVMRVYPDWSTVDPEDGGQLSQWTTQDERGKHTLSVMLTPDGCVCATNATSRFHGGFAQGEMAGLFQGAAVAPVSELDYTGTWLDPKTLMRCPLAFLFRRPYEAQAAMPDGSTWRLTCSRDPTEPDSELVTSLTVNTPACSNAFLGRLPVGSRLSRRVPSLGVRIRWNSRPARGPCLGQPAS